MEGLDEALARRRENESEQASAEREFQERQQRELTHFWEVVDDFLARKRKVAPAHTLVRLEYHNTKSRFGRLPRKQTVTVPLGDGWWAGVIDSNAPSPDYPSRRWSHRAAFLLATGDLVTGTVWDVWQEYSPKNPPLSRSIELSDLGLAGGITFIRHGATPKWPLLRLNPATALAGYL